MTPTALARCTGFFVLLLALVATVPASPTETNTTQQPAKTPAQANTPIKSKGSAINFNRVERKGVVVEFFTNNDGNNAANGEHDLVEGEYADIHFKITDALSHQPLKGLKPGAWLDIGAPLTATGPDSGSCKSKIETYFKGIAGVRPMLDLTSYYILVFNQDNSISVIDPLVGITGKTNLFASIILK